MRMLKLLSRIGLTVGALFAGALPAAAQTYPPPSSVAPTVVTQPEPGPAAEAGGLAFTGAEIGLLLLAVAVLVAVGAFALIMARRRGGPQAA